MHLLVQFYDISRRSLIYTDNLDIYEFITCNNNNINDIFDISINNGILRRYQANFENDKKIKFVIKLKFNEHSLLIFGLFDLFITYYDKNEKHYSILFNKYIPDGNIKEIYISKLYLYVSLWLYDVSNKLYMNKFMELYYGMIKLNNMLNNSGIYSFIQNYTHNYINIVFKYKEQIYSINYCYNNIDLITKKINLDEIIYSINNVN